MRSSSHWRKMTKRTQRDNGWMCVTQHRLVGFLYGYELTGTSIEFRWLRYRFTRYIWSSNGEVVLWVDSVACWSSIWKSVFYRPP
jgi:hypothetical protein